MTSSSLVLRNGAKTRHSFQKSVGDDSNWNHCSCLLERTKHDGPWNVVYIFSVVVLHAALDNQGAMVGMDESNNCQFVDLASGTIAQALGNTMEWALPSPVQVCPVKDLSWATINKQRTPATPNNMRQHIMYKVSREQQCKMHTR
jgi:hypothetical protein